MELENQVVVMNNGAVIAVFNDINDAKSFDYEGFGGYSNLKIVDTKAIVNITFSESFESQQEG